MAIQPLDIKHIFRRIYGDNYGYSPAQQNLMFQQGVSSLSPEFAKTKKAGVTDLGNRGFYSSIPYSNMAGNVGGQYMQALTNYRRGISIESGRAGEQQKSSLFNALSNAETQRYLMELSKKLSKKEFSDLLGQLFGYGMQGAGYALGTGI